jgi:pilus assembly protein CpaE
MAADGIAVATAPAAQGAGERASMLAYVTDDGSDAVLREALLDAAGEGAEVRRGDIVAAMKALRRAATPRVLVVDVSGLDQPVSALEELAQVVEPEVRVLVVGDRTDAAFYRTVTRGLGALEYLYKPLSVEMVSRHFVPLVRGAAAPVAETQIRGGRVIAVIGVRGGVGATTIAANLAWHLAEEARRHTALLDADLHTGSAALLLGARAGAALRGALEHPDRVDELFVERAAQPAGERLQVLAAEERLSDVPQAKAGAAQRLVMMLRRRFNFVVLDVPGRPTTLSRDLLELAHQRVLVFDPTLASAREVLRFAGLPNAPVQARRALLLLNRLGQPGGLPPDKLHEALGEKPELAVPWLPKVVPAAADLGEPAAARKGPFRDAVRALAHAVASVGPASVEAPRRGLFRRRAA